MLCAAKTISRNFHCKHLSRATGSHRVIGCVVNNNDTKYACHGIFILHSERDIMCVRAKNYAAHVEKCIGLIEIIGVAAAADTEPTVAFLL